MKPRDMTVIRAIIKALHVKRTRYGALESTHVEMEAARDMQSLVTSYPLPHGGSDRIDQACMLLQALIGEECVSILDDGTQR